MTTPYGLRIVWEFLENSFVFDKHLSFHCQLSYMDGCEEEVDDLFQDEHGSRVPPADDWLLNLGGKSPVITD